MRHFCYVFVFQMTCVSQTGLQAWLEGGGGHPLAAAPDKGMVGSVLYKGRQFLGKLAFHLKSQQPGQARVTLNQWVNACLFRYHGGGFKPKDEIAVLDRMAFGANLPVRVLTVEKCGSSCSTRGSLGSVHVKVLFISTNTYHLPSTPAHVYLCLKNKLFIILNNKVFFDRYQVIRTDYHSYGGDQATIERHLNSLLPHLSIPTPLLTSLRRRCFETDRKFRLVFFLALEYVDEESVRNFKGLIRAGSWGGGSLLTAQGVIVTLGRVSPHFMLLPIGAMDFSRYQGGAGARQFISPENLKSLVEEESPSSSVDTGSSQTCPCESGETLFSSRPPKKLAQPVGNSEVPDDLVSNLQLLGLWNTDVEQVLDLVTWLSTVSYDIER